MKQGTEFDGATTCQICGCAVMIQSGKTAKRLRRKLAVASHVLALHVKRDAVGAIIRGRGRVNLLPEEMGL